MPARSACCADDSSPNAATRDACALRVTSGGRGQLAFTTREENGEGRKWFQERNGRRVLKIYDNQGTNRYWRAPRPHPRPNRRKMRREKQGILQNALAQKETSSPSTTGDATEAILVLQGAFRDAHCREQKLVESTTAKLAKKERQLQRAKAKIELFAEQVDDTEHQLYSTEAKLHSTEAKLQKARHKIAKMQEEQGAISKKVKRAQEKIGTLRQERDAAASASKKTSRRDGDIRAKIRAEVLKEIEANTLYEQQCAAAYDASYKAYVEKKKLSDAHDFAYMRAQDICTLCCEWQWSILAVIALLAVITAVVLYRCLSAAHAWVLS